MRKLLLLALVMAPAGPFALPQGGVVSEGSANWEQGAGSLVVKQGSDRALLDWNSFDIGSGEVVKFVQPGAGSVAINRVVGGNLLPTQIDGDVFANGNVWILNPNGVLLGGNAKFDVGGLALGAATLGDDDSWNLTGNVENRGTIAAGSGGVVLGGQGVANHGSIVTKNGGNVTLAAGTKMQVGLLNGLVTLETEPSAVPLRVENTGEIVVPGGTAGLMMQAVDAGVGGVINMSGRVVANTVGEQGGVIRLGYAPTVKVSGELRAEGDDAGERGGRVEVLGKDIELGGGAKISADGKAGGGVALVGGDLQGAAGVATAQAVKVGAGSEISARAMEQGDGGKVVVWADGKTQFAGHVAADGAGRGNGGVMEVSGKQNLVFRGTGSALGGTDGGRKGSLLLDPQDIVIANGAGGADDVEIVDGVIGAGENAGGTYTISEQGLEGLSAGTNVTLAATRHITIQNLADNVLTLAATGSVDMIADSDLNGVGDFTMDAGDSILTAADVTLRGANLVLGSLNTSGGDGNLVLETTNSGGNVTLGGTLSSGLGGLTLAGNLQRVAGLNLTNVGAIALSGNSTLTGGNIVMDAANTVTGAHTLAVNGNAVTLAGVSGLTGLTMNGTGAVNFLGDIVTNGAVNVGALGGMTGASGAWNVATGSSVLTLQNGLTLAGATTLNSGGGALTLQTVDGAHALVLNSGAGNAVVNGALGGVTPLASVVHSGHALSVAGVRTTAAQTYNAATTVQGTVRSTAGNIAFANSVVLGGNTAVQVAGANNVGFAGTVDGAHDLNVTTGTGVADFNGSVGGGVALSNLTVTGNADVDGDIVASGNVQMTGGTVNLRQDMTAGGDLTLGGILNLGADSVLTVGGANGDVITLQNAITGAHDLTLVAGAGQVALAGMDVATLNLTSGDGVTLNAGNYLTDTAQDWSNMGALTLGGDAMLVAGNGPGYANLMFGSGNTLAGAGHGLALTGSNVGLRGMSGVNVLAVNGSAIMVNNDIATVGTQTFNGPVTLGGNLTTTNDNITVNGAVLLAGNRVIDTGAGAADITLGSTVNGASALSLNAGTGDVHIGGNVGSVTPLTGLSISAFESFLKGVRTTGAIDVTGDVTLAGLMDAGTSIYLHDDMLASTGAAMTAGTDLTVAGQIAMLANLTLASGGGAGDVLTLGSGAIGDYLLTLTAGLGDVDLTGNFDLDGLLLASGDDLIYGGGSILTDNAMVFTTLNRVLLGGDTVIAAQEGGVKADVTFGGANQILATVPGVDLTVTGDTVTLYQIGDTGSGVLDSLTVNAGTAVLLGDIYTIGNQTINATQGLAGLLFSAGGDITLNTAATLVGNVTVQSHGGNVYFQNSLNGAYNLLVDAGGGDIFVNAMLGLHAPLARVDMTGNDIYLTQGIHTLGSQNYDAQNVYVSAGLYSYAGSFVYDSPVTLTGDSLMETRGGDIVFNNTVDGHHDLKISTGSGDLKAPGRVGGNERLAAVTVDGSGNVAWTGGLTTDVYNQYNVAGLTDLRGAGIESEGDVNIGTSGRVLGHIGGNKVYVEARDGWTGTVAARGGLVLSTKFTELEGTVMGMGGRSAAVRTYFGNFYGGRHYLNGYGLPVHELSVATPATSGGALAWRSGFGTQVGGYEGMPVDGLWDSLLDWPDTWDTVGGELWRYSEDVEPAAGPKASVESPNQG